MKWRNVVAVFLALALSGSLVQNYRQHRKIQEAGARALLTAQAEEKRWREMVEQQIAAFEAQGRYAEYQAETFSELQVIWRLSCGGPFRGIVAETLGSARRSNEQLSPYILEQARGLRRKLP